MVCDYTDPNNWSTYEEAVATGLYIGFVLTAEDPFTIIDLDNKAEDPATPEELERHKQIFEAFADTYAELSVSGRGVHIVCRGQVPHGAKRDKVEVYSSARYMICTGQVLRDAPIIDHQPLLNLLFQEVSRNGHHEDYPELEEWSSDISDATLVEVASTAANADKFNKLCAGDWQGEYPSQSEADFALLSILAFYTRSNDQVKRVFRMTGLGKREKAWRNDYLDMCLRKIRREEVEPVDFSAFVGQNDPTGRVSTIQGGDDVRERERQPTSVGSGDVVNLNGGPVRGEGGAGGSGPVREVLDASDSASLPIDKPDLRSVGGTVGVPSLPPGFVGDLANYIYSTSSRPVPEIGIAAALALAAGICGRQFNISSSGLNLYIMLLAKTGVGKEGGTQGVERLMAAVRTLVPVADEFIGPSNFASGQGMIRTLDERPCFVSMVGEFGTLLQEMSADNANAIYRTMRRNLLDLYSKSGYGVTMRPTAYSDKERNTKTLLSPALTLLGESVPEEFYAGLSLFHVANGLIPRFLTIETFVDRVPRNRPYPEGNAFAPVPEWMVNRLAELCSVCMQMQSNQSWANVQLDEEATRILDSFDTECDNHIRSSNTDAIRQLWNRAHLKALRITGVLTAADRPHTPVSTGREASWAVDLVRRDTMLMVDRFERGDVGVGETKQAAELERVIGEWFSRPWKELKVYGGTETMQKMGIVPHVYLSRRTSPLSAFVRHRMGARAALREAINELIMADRLQEIPKKDMQVKFGTGQRAYGYVKSFV
jgi:hypothetical protein